MLIDFGRTTPAGCARTTFISVGIVLLAALAGAHAPATLWTKCYGGAADDMAHTIVGDGSGGFVIAGLTGSSGAGGWDVWLLGLDSLGAIAWDRTYGGSADEAGIFMSPVRRGGFIIAGYTTSFGSGGMDVYLVRTDSAGDTLWTRTYGSSLQDLSYVVHETADSGFVVAGYRDGPSEFVKGDLWLLRLDAAGETLWTRIYGGAGEEMAHAVEELPDGGFLLAGHTSTYGAGNKDLWLLRTDARGETLWTRVYGGTKHDVGYDVAPAHDGFFVTGYIDGPSSSIGGDLWLLRIDDSGDTLWTKRYGGSGAEVGLFMRAVSDSEWLITGSTASRGAGGDDVWLLKVNDRGDTVWTSTYGGRQFDGGGGFTACPDGYAVVGYTSSFGAGGADLYIIRTGPDTAAVTESWGSAPRPPHRATVLGSRVVLPAGAALCDATGRRVLAASRPGVYYIVEHDRVPAKVVRVR